MIAETSSGATNHRRTVFAARDGRWKFSSSGEPYPFEDIRCYEATRIRDRFTPEHLVNLLVGLGAPLSPFSKAKEHSGVLFVQDGMAPHLKRWTFAEVQAGLLWKQA